MVAALIILTSCASPAPEIKTSVCGLLGDEITRRAEDIWPVFIPMWAEVPNAEADIAYCADIAGTPALGKQFPTPVRLAAACRAAVLIVAQDTFNSVSLETVTLVIEAELLHRYGMRHPPPPVCRCVSHYFQPMSVSFREAINTYLAKI